jgi:translation initiation factor 2 subunit 2
LITGFIEARHASFKKGAIFHIFMDYKELLDKARKELPTKSESHDRFEVPKVRGHVQGNRTVISNFVQIASAINRDADHLLKFILKELATPGEIKNNVLILGRKVSSVMINDKIDKYVKELVICKECKKPDTKLIKEDKITFVRCQACGAKHPVQTRI